MPLIQVAACIESKMTGDLKASSWVVSLVGCLGLFAGALSLFERSSILAFYRQRLAVVCAGHGAASMSEGVDRHAVSNFYLAALESSGLGSHVSRRIGYHRLMADLVIAKLMMRSQLDVLYEETPCGFRRR
jgi:predicted benzoate:H+ symporter BenE